MAEQTQKKEILLRSEQKHTFKENFQYTLHEMRRNIGCYGMIAPFMIFFIMFTVIPVIMSLPMGFTDFDMAHFPPKFVGFDNFYTLFVEDDVFIKSIRTTLIFAVFTGPLSYALSFMLAWLINELHPVLKTVFTLIFYAPSMAGNIYFVWQLIFSGDSYGYLNAFLNSLGFTTGAIQWLTDANYVLPCVIVVQLWISMGAGFPSTDYKVHTIMTHAFDYGWVRYEMGYSSAICFVLFLVMLLCNQLITKVLGKYMNN